MGFFATHGADGEVPKSRLYYVGFTLPGSVASAVGAGAATVTPASMYGIEAGKVLTVVDAFLSNVATAPSPATSGTSLVLTAGDGAKCPPTPFYANVWPAGESVSTTLAKETVQVTNVTGDTLTIVRAGSPRTIIVGDQFAICLVGGATTTESVTVTGTSSTQFTATYANPHAAGWTFMVPIPVYWTDYDINIVWNGHTWTAMPITNSQVSHQPDGDSGSFRLADADDVWFPVLAANNGGELAPAEIYEAGFLTTNKTAVPDEVIQLFTGVVDRASVATAGEDNLTFVLMPPIQASSGQLPTRLATSLVRIT